MVGAKLFLILTFFFLYDFLDILDIIHLDVISMNLISDGLFCFAFLQHFKLSNLASFLGNITKCGLFLRYNYHLGVLMDNVSACVYRCARVQELLLAFLIFKHEAAVVRSVRLISLDVDRPHIVDAHLIPRKLSQEGRVQ